MEGRKNERRWEGREDEEEEEEGEEEDTTSGNEKSRWG